MPRITSFLSFENQAEEAANFYVSLFKNSRITRVVRVQDAGPGPKGRVLVVDFELDGRTFSALNGGPEFKFNQGVSFVIHCETQAEVDEYWSKLTTAGGQEIECGWLKDKYGLSWQVTPDILIEMLADNDSQKASRVMEAMMKMKKIDIATLKKAYDQSPA